VVYYFDTMNKRNIIICFVLLISSIVIMYPENIHELFYYDDNPIRYMVAKKFVEGGISDKEKKIFLAYGSSEIFFPPFFLSKHIGLDYEVTYNISILLYFILFSALLIPYVAKTKRGVAYIYPVFLILGIICVVKGSAHWYISSTMFFTVLMRRLEKKESILDFFLLGVAYFISPPIFVFVILIFPFLERKILFILPMIFAIPKFLIVSEVSEKVVEESLRLIIKEGVEKSGFMARRSFLPPDIYIVIRPATMDYLKFSLPFLPMIYISGIRGLFTMKKIMVVEIILFYLVVVLSVIIMKEWYGGKEFPNSIITLSALLYSHNPFRYLPIFLAFLVLHSKDIRSDEFWKFVVLALFCIRALFSLVSPELRELPQGIPKEVKELIHFINEETEKNARILVEGDIHISKRGKIIHPLYDSHIISYISAEVKRDVIGGIIPWEIGDFSFIGGKFQSKPLDSSEIDKFIAEEKVDYVICWTRDCKEFFSSKYGKIKKIGKFYVVELEKNLR